MDKLPIINLNPPRVKLALNIAQGMTQKQAFKEAFGRDAVDKQELTNTVHSPQVNRLRQAIERDIQEELKSNATSALDVVIQLMSDGAVPANVRLQAAKDILDRAGYNPTNKVANVTKQFNQITLTDSEKIELKKALDSLK